MKGASSLSPKQPTDTRAAGRVAARIELDSVRLVSSFFQLQGPVDDEDVRNYHTERFATPYLHEDGLTIQVSFRLAADHADDEGSDGDDPPLLVYVDYLLDYAITGEGEFTENELESFADINAVFNCWPYWRQLVQSTLPAMGLPALTIPVFKIPLFSKDEPTERPRATVAKTSGTTATKTATKQATDKKATSAKKAPVAKKAGAAKR